MNRLLLFLIEHATPVCDREYLVGDVAEGFEAVRASAGPAAARAWLRRETTRVLRQAIAHHAAVRRRSTLPRADRDGAMTSFLQDLRHSCRALARSPGFAAIGIATLGLGIGVNTAMFAVVNGVLLKPLPFAHVDRLMMVHLLSREPDGATSSENVWSFPKFQAFQAAQQVFEDSGLFIGLPATLTGDEAAPESIETEVVTSSYHRTLGVSPILGRAFTPQETDVAGAQPLVILSHGLWTRRFGSDVRVVGRSIPINDVPHTVIGVLPAGFRGLSGQSDAWLPLASQYAESLTVWGWHSYYLVARRKAAVSEEAARASVAVLGARIESTQSDSPPPGHRPGASARSLDASRADADVRNASLMLLGAVGFVLLIACVNLTNLVATRALARRRDVALRLAIGATRFRIVRQFAADGLVLGACGAVVGVTLSAFLLKAATRLLPEASVFFRTPIAPGVVRMSGTEGLTRIAASMVGLDFATLAFAAGATALTALLIAVVPAWRASSLQPADALRAGRSASERGFGTLSARSVLVTVQVGLALVLLTGAGLMIRSAIRLHDTDIGLRPDHVVTLEVSLPSRVYTGPKRVAFFDQLVERVRAVPGVESVSIGNCLPVSGGCNSTEMSELPRQPGATEGTNVAVFWVGPDYFSMLGIKLVAGRGFSRDDVAGRPKVVLISETAARRVWPNASPLGKTVSIGQGGFSDGAEIIGIVSDVRYHTIEEAPRPVVYLPVAQSPRTRMRLFVRAQSDAASLAPPIMREVRALDASLALPAFKTLEAQIDDAMWRTRVAAWLLSALAALAALLTAIGIFGVMAQVVLQRTAEIGIRIALGADRRAVLSLVLGRAASITVAGLVGGTMAALGFTRLLSTFLYQIAPHDPLTFACVAGVLGVVALLASYIPARRATRVDAVIALRGE